MCILKKNNVNLFDCYFELKEIFTSHKRTEQLLLSAISISTYIQNSGSLNYNNQNNI